ncbi:MAG: aldehyde dehydrogenase family protein [Bdellovibrionota bacterium]
MISLKSVLQTDMIYRGSFVDGSWRPGSGTSWKVVSPANFEWVLPEVFSSSADADESVASARRAFKEWKDLGIETRISFLRKFSDELMARKDRIARVMAVEIGKPLEECIAEAQVLKTKIDVTIEHGLKLVEKETLDLGAGSRGEIRYLPKGILVVIGPFNFPTHLSNGHIIPALLMGNVCILKPSEKAPFSAQVYMEAAEAAGFPRGVIQLVQGQGEVAVRLLRNPEVDGVLATTSYEIGAKIQKELGEKTEKIVALEMGGKNAAIVWTGADLDKVADDLIKSSYLTTGQRCTALSRVYVQEKLLPSLVERVHARAKELVISHPFDEDPKPFMGPIISLAAKDKFLRYSDIAESEGAEVVMRPKALHGIPRKNRKPLPEGHYVSPSLNIVPKWNPKSPYQTHEIFGPDLFLCPVRELDEAIAAVNASDYGLAFSFFGGDEALFTKVANDVQTGLAYWNRPTTGASGRLPFGGWKRSGNHWPAGLFAIYASTQVQARIL